MKNFEISKNVENVKPFQRTENMENFSDNEKDIFEGIKNL